VTAFERWAVWLTSAVTAGSGLGFFWTKYVLDSPDPWSVINHPLEPWLLRVHVVAAPLFVFAIGLVTGRHIWRHLLGKVQPGRRSGLVATIALIPMVLGGYLVQVVTHDGWLRGLALAHIVIGLVFTLGIVIHGVAVRGVEEGSEVAGSRSEPPARVMPLGRSGGAGRRGTDETFRPLVRSREMRTETGGVAEPKETR
jgi:hypothetical protein